MKHPTKSEIARALGISAPGFSRYIKRGCPVYSIEAAREWQRQHVDPSQRLMRRVPPPAPVVDTDARIERVHALALLAEADFAPYGEALRAAMRSVPAGARSSVELPMTVWRQLLPRGLAEAVPADPAGVHAQTVQEADEAGLAVYALACGELRINP